MSVLTPPDLQTCRVSWEIAWTRDAPDVELEGARGFVMFEPSTKVINFSGTTLLPVAVRTPVSGGVMTPVAIPANNPDIWNWKVTPHVGVAWDPFHIDAPGEESVDLSTAAVTPGKGPIRAVTGYRGASAYEVAVANGYTGTEADWIELLTAYAITDATVFTESGEAPDGDVSVVDRQMRLRLTLPKGDQGDRGPEGPYGGTEVTDPQISSMVTDGESETRGALLSTLTTTGTRPVGKGELVANVKDFGAVGDGTGNDTAAIQAALDAARSVLIPAGTYPVGTLNVPSGTTLDMAPNAVLDSIYGTHTVLDMTGTPGEEITLEAVPTTDDLGRPRVATTVPHGLEPGDTIRIMSQRDALSPDAGLDWRLGYATPSAQGCYFAEFLRVESVQSDTEFTGSQPLVFPVAVYRPDDSEETSEHARPAATVQHVDFVSDVKIRGGRIEGTPANGIHVAFGHRVRISDVTFDWKDTATGALISIRDSLACEAVDCSGTYPPFQEPVLTRRNAFKIVSGQACGFVGCSVENPTQGFDITYTSGTGPSLDCYVVNSSTFGAQLNSATSHPGTYATQFLSNRFLHCWRSGLSVRSRSSIVTGNRVTGGARPDSYGIGITEGWARDCIVSNNSVTGFQWGLYARDGSNPEQRFGWLGLHLLDNTVSGCPVPIYAMRSGGNTFDGPCGLSIEGNVVQYRSAVTGEAAVMIDNNHSGVRVRRNIINGGGVGRTGMRFATGNTETVIEQNDFINLANSGIFFSNPPGSQTANVYASRNHFVNVGSGPGDHFPTTSRVRVMDAGFFNSPFTSRQSLPASPSVADVVSALRAYGLVT